MVEALPQTTHAWTDLVEGRLDEHGLRSLVEAVNVARPETVGLFEPLLQVQTAQGDDDRAARTRSPGGGTRSTDAPFEVLSELASLLEEATKEPAPYQHHSKWMASVLERTKIQPLPLDTVSDEDLAELVAQFAEWMSANTKSNIQISRVSCLDV